MSQPVNLTDAQFNGANQERERRLVEDLRKLQSAYNTLLAEHNELVARVAALEAAAP